MCRGHRFERHCATHFAGTRGTGAITMEAARGTRPARGHAGWSLLRAQNAPLAVSFFIAAFTGTNLRNIGRQQLIDTLDDVLFGVRDAYGEDKFPRPAAEYLDDWAAPERAWLRKYYVPGQDEPRYDLTAAAEDVVRWVESLRGRDFVATQSRLTSIFAVLKALVQQSETDPEVRLAELQRPRAPRAPKPKPRTLLSAPIATEEIMATIPHRELRNNSSKILQRVKNGETIDVTNNGEVAATLIPPSASPFERLLLSGHVRPADQGAVDYRAIPRIKSDAGTTEILADLRGDR